MTEHVIALVISDDLAERVNLLLERNAVAFVVGYERRVAVVNGVTGWYRVTAHWDAVSCDCEAGSTGAVCSHSLAAQVRWAEL